MRICSPALPRVMPWSCRHNTQGAFPATGAHARKPPEVQSVTHARIKGSRDDSEEDGFVEMTFINQNFGGPSLLQLDSLFQNSMHFTNGLPREAVLHQA